MIITGFHSRKKTFYSRKNLQLLFNVSLHFKIEFKSIQVRNRHFY